MDIETLQVGKTIGETEYLIINPGLNFTLYIAIPVPDIAKYVLEALEKYLAFIPDGAIGGCQGANGEYRALTARTLNTHKKLLKAMPKSFEYYDLDLSRDEKGDAGGFAFHFEGSPLDDDDLPLETNRISMEFPHDFYQNHDVEPFIVNILEAIPCDCAWFGFAFNHDKISEQDARPQILKYAARYHGIDVDYGEAMEEMRGMAPNVNWYTFIKHDIVEELGGIQPLKTLLDDDVKLLELKHGALFKAGDAPAVGDINHGAEDAAALRRVANILKPKRFSISGFGTPDFDAMQWLGRFDDDK